MQNATRFGGAFTILVLICASGRFRQVRSDPGFEDALCGRHGVDGCAHDRHRGDRICTQRGERLPDPELARHGQQRHHRHPVQHARTRARYVFISYVSPLGTSHRLYVTHTLTYDVYSLYTFDLHQVFFV